MKIKLLFCCVLFILMSCKKQPKNEVKATDTTTENQIKENQEKSPTLEDKLIEKGINFYARGHEPSWALDMDFEGNFHFKTLNGDEISVPAVKGDRAMDANVTRFYAEVEKGTLIITIIKQKCQDSMADQSFDFSVNVQMKNSNETEFKEFSGCGTFLPDLALHDIWVLDKINNEDLVLNDNQERPRFEFFSKKGEVLGNAGCNNFNGRFSIEGYKVIQFTNVAMTRKTCGDMKVEQLLSKHVFGRQMKYYREDLLLHLSGYDGTELIFKKVD